MTDIIDTLATMDDSALMAKLGLDKKLSKAKEDLAELAKLPAGDARDAAVEKVNNLLNPTIYSDELGWIADSAQRKLANGAADEMCCCDPSSLDMD